MDYSQITGGWQLIALIIVVIIAPHAKDIAAFLIPKFRSSGDQNRLILDEIRKLQKTTSKLEFYNAVRHQPLEESLIRNLYKYMSGELGMNGEITKAYTKWETDHLYYASSEQRVKLKKIVNVKSGEND